MGGKARRVAMSDLEASALLSDIAYLLRYPCRVWVPEIGRGFWVSRVDTVARRIRVQSARRRR